MNYSAEIPGTSSQVPVRCEFADGTQHMLVAREVTLAGAWIPSMRPPAAGTVLDVVLCPSTSPALAPLKAVVSNSRLDPADASVSGFEVLFVSLHEEALEDLSLLIWGFSRKKPVRPAERRTAPRVPLREDVVISIAHLHCPAVVRDVSMTGALVEFPDLAPLVQGDHVTLVLGPRRAKLRVRCKVARLEAEGQRVGLRFVGLTREAAHYLEILMLEQINALEVLPLAS